MKPIDQADRLKLIVLAAFIGLACLCAASAFGQASTNVPAVMTELEASRLQIDSPAQQALKEKLDRIVVRKVESNGKTLREMMAFLSFEANGALPAGESVSFLINAPPNFSQWGTPGHGQTEALTEELALVPIHINPPLRNVTLSAAIDAVVKGAERPIQFELKDYGATFAWKQPPMQRIFTRRFSVNTNRFLVNLAHASGLDSPAGLRAFGQTLAPVSKTNSMSIDVGKVLRRHLQITNVGRPTIAVSFQVFYSDPLGIVLVRAPETELRNASAAILALDPDATSLDWTVNGKGPLNGMVPTPEKDLLPLPKTAALPPPIPAPAPPKPNPTNMVTRVYYLGPATFTNRLQQLGFGLKPVATNPATAVSFAMQELLVRLGAFKPVAPTVSVIVTNQAVEPFSRLVTGSGSITNRAAREFFSTLGGGRLITNYPPSSYVGFNERKGLLLLKSTYADLATAETVIQFLTGSQYADRYAQLLGLPPGADSVATLYPPLQVSASASNELRNGFYQILDRQRLVALVSPSPNPQSLNRKSIENALLRYFARIGADFNSEEPEGKILLYDDVTKRILARGSQSDFAIVERVVEKLNEGLDPSGPGKKRGP